jgi:predicted GNAT family N-acyltransferase
VHLGAFDGDRLVGIASLYREDRPGGPAGGWRLRGMATEPDARGAGFGAALLAGSVEHAAAAGGSEVWCNARMPAVDFYRRAGFAVVSEEFEIDGIGPHVVMAR